MVCYSGGNRIPPYGRWGDDTGSASLAGMVSRPMGGGGDVAPPYVELFG